MYIPVGSSTNYEEKVPHEKLIVTQLVKKFPVLFWNPKAHHRIQKNPPLLRDLSHLIQSTPFHPISLRSCLLSVA